MRKEDPNFLAAYAMLHAMVDPSPDTFFYCKIPYNKIAQKLLMLDTFSAGVIRVHKNCIHIFAIGKIIA